MPEIFKENVYKKYYANTVSLGYLISWISLLSGILLSFYFTSKYPSFYNKYSTYIEKPKVEYTNFIILLEGTTKLPNDADRIEPLKIESSSLIKDINYTMIDNRPYNIKRIEKDTDNDTLNDFFSFNITIPIHTNESIHGMTALFFFNYTLSTFVKFNMDVIAYISIETLLNEKNVVFIDGKMDLQIDEAMEITENLRKPYPELLNITKIKSTSDIGIKDILINYTRREVKCNFKHLSPLWQKLNNNDSSYFTAEVNIKFPFVNIRYRLGNIEKIKIAWNQYYPTFIFVTFFIFILEQFIYRHKIIGSISNIDMDRKGKDIFCQTWEKKHF